MKSKKNKKYSKKYLHQSQLRSISQSHWLILLQLESIEIQAAEVPTIAETTNADFHYIKVLGRGSFGKVCLGHWPLTFDMIIDVEKGHFKVLMAQHKTTREMFAIKCLSKEALIRDNDEECAMLEMRVLAIRNKPLFLTQLHSTFQTFVIRQNLNNFILFSTKYILHFQDKLFFVMEYVDGGDLMHHLGKKGKFKHEETVYVNKFL